MRYSLIPSARAAPHYGVLLVVLLILSVVGPAVHAETAGYGVEFFFDLVLVTGAYSAAWQSKHRLPFLALTVATLAVRWTDMALDHTGFSLISVVLVVAWLVYAVGLIMVALFRMPDVNTNTILGGRLETVGGNLFEQSAVTTLESVTNNGTYRMNGGATLNISGSGLTKQPTRSAKSAVRPEADTPITRSRRPVSRWNHAWNRLELFRSQFVLWC